MSVTDKYSASTDGLREAHPAAIWAAATVEYGFLLEIFVLLLMVACGEFLVSTPLVPGHDNL